MINSLPLTKQVKLKTFPTPHKSIDVEHVSSENVSNLVAAGFEEGTKEAQWQMYCSVMMK